MIFRKQDLSGYIFKSCTLTGTNFSGCTFDASTDFTNAFFGKSSSNTPTNFSGCDLTAAKFRVPANFGGMATRDVPTNLTNTKLSWTLLGKQMQYVDITGAVFTDIPTDLSMCLLTSVTWKNFDFTGKTLKNTHFNNCDLTGCIMTGVVLDYVSFVQVTNLTNVKMNKCSLYHTVFDGSTMTNTDLSYATKRVLAAFRKLYPGKKDTIVQALTVDWTKDKFSPTCEMEPFPIGEMHKFWPQITRPDGRIYFAGTYADNLSRGMESCIRSAQRVAKEINEI